MVNMHNDRTKENKHIWKILYSLSLMACLRLCHNSRSHRKVKLKRKLQIYLDTRFNRAFYMLNVFHINYDDLCGVINNNFIDYLTGINKELLEELRSFLELFDQVIDQLSDEERPTIQVKK